MSLSKKFRRVFSMTYAKIGQNFTYIVEARNSSIRLVLGSHSSSEGPSAKYPRSQAKFSHVWFLVSLHSRSPLGCNPLVG